MPAVNNSQPVEFYQTEEIPVFVESESCPLIFFETDQPELSYHPLGHYGLNPHGTLFPFLPHDSPLPTDTE